MKYQKSLEIVADFISCSRQLDDPKPLLKEIKRIFKNNKIGVLKTTYYIFPNNGATILLLLSASHFALHTWPEKDLVNIDLFFCNYNADNRDLIKATYEDLRVLFTPKEIKKHGIHRIT